MVLEEFEQEAIKDRLEGWELVEFLQVSIDQVLLAALEFGWIDEESVEDVLEFAGVKQK